MIPATSFPMKLKSSFLTSKKSPKLCGVYGLGYTFLGSLSNPPIPSRFLALFIVFSNMSARVLIWLFISPNANPATLFAIFTPIALEFSLNCSKDSFLFFFLAVFFEDLSSSSSPIESPKLFGAAGSVSVAPFDACIAVLGGRVPTSSTSAFITR